MQTTNIKPGNVAGFLAAIATSLDAIWQQDAFDWWEYSPKLAHLSEPQTYQAFADILHFFEGQPANLSKTHAEIFRELGLHSLQFVHQMEKDDGRNIQYWERRQLRHTAQMLNIKAPEVDKMWGSPTEQLIETISQAITETWQERETIHEPDEAQVQAIIDDIHEKSGLLYYSRRKLRALGVKETPEGCETYALLHWTLGRVLIHKRFAKHPTIEEVQKAIDDGPLDWDLTKDEFDLGSDKEFPGTVWWERPTKYGMDD